LTVAKFLLKFYFFIDCVIETQDITWSDYKSHITEISPTDYITFLSNCYGGKASDRFICKDGCFYNLLDVYDVMKELFEFFHFDSASWYKAVIPNDVRCFKL